MLNILQRTCGYSESQTKSTQSKLSLQIGTILALSMLLKETVLGQVPPDEDNDVIDRVTGHLYIFSDTDGGHRRLNKRDIYGMNGPQNVKLDLGLSYGSIEMSLSKHNVWTADSQVFQRVGAGREAVEADVQIQKDCFISGFLLSQDGVASFVHCDGLKGFVQTPDVEYIVEEKQHTDHQSPADWEFPELIVTLFRHNQEFDEGLNIPDTPKTNSYEEDDESGETDKSDDKEESEDEDVDKLMKEEESFFNDTLSANDTANDTQDTRLTKRATPSPIAAEIAIYVNKNFADYLKKRGVNTAQKVSEFMITKWNAVAKVYGDVQKVGVPFDIQLKRIEIWWNNPAFYKPVQNDQNMGKHLSAFCKNTKTQPADHRMLYTHGVGGRVAGIAYVGQVCRASHSCSVVRSTKRSAVFVELHEFGHSLGFHHDPKMECPKPYGFMGWRHSTFRPCYRKKLLERLPRRSMMCLRQRNIQRYRLNQQKIQY